MHFGEVVERSLISKGEEATKVDVEPEVNSEEEGTTMPMKPVQVPNTRYDKAELRERLDPIEYYVTQEKGTER